MMRTRGVFAAVLALSWLGVLLAVLRQETFASSSRENLAWILVLWLTTCVLLTVSLSLRWPQGSPRNSAMRTHTVLGLINILVSAHIYLVLGLTNWLASLGNHILAPAIGFFIGLLTLTVGASVPVALICDIYLLTLRRAPPT